MEIVAKGYAISPGFVKTKICHPEHVTRNVTAKMLSAILIRNAPAGLRVSGTALRVTLKLALKLVWIPFLRVEDMLHEDS